MHDSLKFINIWELWWEISCRYDTATCICVADLDLSGQKKLLLGTYGQVRALYNPSVLEKELVSVVLGCKCKTLNYWLVDINIISHDLTRYLKTNIQGAVGLQTEWRTNVGLRVAAKSPSSHSQSMSGLLKHLFWFWVCIVGTGGCVWFNWEKEVMWTQVDMTGDGVKELVVVTTRGVQVNKKQNKFPKWEKYSLTSYHWHQSISCDDFSLV